MLGGTIGAWRSLARVPRAPHASYVKSKLPGCSRLPWKHAISRALSVQAAGEGESQTGSSPAPSFDDRGGQSFLD